MSDAKYVECIQGTAELPRSDGIPETVVKGEVYAVESVGGYYYKLVGLSAQWSQARFKLATAPQVAVAQPNNSPNAPEFPNSSKPLTDSEWLLAQMKPTERAMFEASRNRMVMESAAQLGYAIELEAMTKQESAYAEERRRK